MRNKTKPFEDRSYTIFAVDFDGVLCENDWPRIGRPLKKNIDAIKWFRKQGNKVILWTNRTGLRLDHAVEWSREHALEFDAINDNLPEVIAYYGDNPRKISADYYIDDKAIVFNRYTNRAGLFGFPLEDSCEIPKCIATYREGELFKVSFQIDPEDIEKGREINEIFSKTVEERIRDGEVDPEYFFEVPT